jgi:hypothetical protein
MEAPFTVKNGDTIRVTPDEIKGNAELIQVCSI